MLNITQCVARNNGVTITIAANNLNPNLTPLASARLLIIVKNKDTITERFNLGFLINCPTFKAPSLKLIIKPPINKKISCKVLQKSVNSL